MDNADRKTGKLKTFFREEGAKLKPMTGSQRVEYLWEYYKMPVLVTGFALLLIVSILVSVLSGITANVRLFGMISTGADVTDTETLASFREEHGYGKHDKLTLDSAHTYYNDSATDYTFSVVFAGNVQTHMLDFMICGKSTLDYVMQTNTAMDLKMDLPDDLVKKAEERLVWCEYEKQEDDPEAWKDYDPGYFCADITDTPLGREVGNGENAYFVIFRESEHREEAESLLEFILR